MEKPTVVFTGFIVSHGDKFNVQIEDHRTQTFYVCPLKFDSVSLAAKCLSEKITSRSTDNWLPTFKPVEGVNE